MLMLQVMTSVAMQRIAEATVKDGSTVRSHRDLSGLGSKGRH